MQVHALAWVRLYVHVATCILIVFSIFIPCACARGKVIGFVVVVVVGVVVVSTKIAKSQKVGA